VVALSLDVLVAGAVGVAIVGRSQPQVSTFRHLPAGHPERRRELCPAHALLPRGGNQLRLPAAQLFAQVPQQHQSRQQLGTGQPAGSRLGPGHDGVHQLQHVRDGAPRWRGTGRIRAQLPGCAEAVELAAGVIHSATAADEVHNSSTFR
jgi:hypothetical protein